MTSRSVVLVDWLGRGGIAQTSESWAIELERAGRSVEVITRSGRELGAGIAVVSRAQESRNALFSHWSLCRYAAERIQTIRPDVVVVQNYVVPMLEGVVHRAARRVGASVVFVVHDHRHHEWREGAHLGLERMVRCADRVVAHSAAVASALGRSDVVVLPLPVQLGLVDLVGVSPIDAVPERLLALQIGILNRAYKGVDLGKALAEHGAPGWAFAFAGVGAPSCRGAQSVDRFLDADELVAAVTCSDAVLLPYRHATQSGAVVLAQACGTAVVASAVDGIVEQVEHGETGLLVPADSEVPAWRDALETLADPATRSRLGEAGRRSAWHRHASFVEGVVALTAGG